MRSFPLFARYTINFAEWAQLNESTKVKREIFRGTAEAKALADAAQGTYAAGRCHWLALLFAAHCRHASCGTGENAACLWSVYECVCVCVCE